MDLFAIVLKMLRKYALCDTCLGRQFALLGHGVDNDERGRMLKLGLLLHASELCYHKKHEGFEILKILAQNALLKEAEMTLDYFGKHFSKQGPQKNCFLCADRFKLVEGFTEKLTSALAEYEYSTFLVGIELPVNVEEREDEFKAEFKVVYGESIRHEFGRLFGKFLSDATHKTVDFKKPDLTIILNPFEETIRVQSNPLFIAGRYRKLVRNIPQSTWFCSNCQGKGCDKCAGTGKMYPESVEELISKPILAAAVGEKTAFHASGREDIDARMLGKGRPFVVEVSKPKRRVLDLAAVEKEINESGKGKVSVSHLRVVTKELVGELKKAEGVQKEYRVLVEFEKDVDEASLRLLEKQLTGAVIKQRTPLRVLHRRADLTREKYIYKVKVKKVSPNRVELQILCQGGLYIKELVSGDEGRTMPSVSNMLGIKAKPLRLDVLGVIAQNV